MSRIDEPSGIGITGVYQSNGLGLAGSLRDRVRQLGLTLVRVKSDTSLEIEDGGNHLARLLTGSSRFADAVGQHCRKSVDQSVLLDSASPLIEIWPEVWLLPLTGGLAQPCEDGHMSPADWPALLLIGHGFITSEWFGRLCDEQGVDKQTVADQASAEGLMSRAEAGRLADLLSWMDADLDLARARQRDLRSLSLHLGGAYEELSLLYKLSVNLTIDHPPEHQLLVACQELYQALRLRWVAVQLVGSEPFLNKMAGRVYIAGEVNCDKQLLKRIGRMIMLSHQGGAQPMVVDDTALMEIPHLTDLAKHMIVTPLLCEGRLIGVLLAADKLEGSQISSFDSKLCASFGASLSIFLQNAMLYEDTQTMFIGTMHALTSAIDAKDRYTRGHSERVALMSKCLAAAAGQDEHTAERVYISALMHDVGKIGVPERVLCKAGLLEAHEFDLIKKHPEIGAKILADIRQMQDLVPGVLYHHERWDGEGYPYGLRGESIPLFGRLIAIADSFDAMSSDRTYRASMSHEQALEEIRCCSGSQFDPRLAKIFVELDFAAFFELIEKHGRQGGGEEGTSLRAAG